MFLESLLFGIKKHNCDVVFSNYDVINEDGSLRRGHITGPLENLIFGNVLGASFFGGFFDIYAAQYRDPLKLFNVNKMIIGHTPQSFLLNKDINGTCGDQIWRVDNGSSSAFDTFDKFYKENGKKHHNRRFQYLEILNDSEYHVWDESGRVF